MKALESMCQSLLAIAELVIAITVVVLMRGVDRVRGLIPGISIGPRDRSTSQGAFAANTTT